MTMGEFVLMLICLGVFGLGLLVYALYLADKEIKGKGGRRDNW